jgi:hypothetical protein
MIPLPDAEFRAIADNHLPCLPPLGTAPAAADPDDPVSHRNAEARRGHGGTSAFLRVPRIHSSALPWIRWPTLKQGLHVSGPLVGDEPRHVRERAGPHSDAPRGGTT